MAVIANYSQNQINIIDSIIKAGLYKGAITRVLVIMATNNYYRTICDLAGILCEYPGMPSQEELIPLIQECIDKGYLVEEQVLDSTYVYIDNDGLSRLLQEYPIHIQQMIMTGRKAYRDSVCVEVLGLLSGEVLKGNPQGYINTSFLQRLEDARSEIYLPMLNTSPSDKVISILKKKAKEGVKIYILLADYETVTKKIRSGKPDMTPNWVEQLKNIDNILIRKYYHIEDSIIYSSLVVDKTLCRICVFDPIKEKSSNGTMIEVCKTNYDLNLVNIIVDTFNSIWIESVPVDENIFSRLIRRRESWILFSIIVSLIIFFNTEGDVHEIVLNICMALAGVFVSLVYTKLKISIKRGINRFKRK